MTDSEIESMGNRDGVLVIRRSHATIIALIVTILGALVAWNDRNSASASGMAELKAQVGQNTDTLRQFKNDRELLVSMNTKIVYIEQAVRGLETRERDRDR